MSQLKNLLHILVWCCLFGVGSTLGVSPNAELPVVAQQYTEITTAEPELEPEPEPPITEPKSAETPVLPPPDPAAILPQECRKLAEIDIRADRRPEVVGTKVADGQTATPKKVALVRLYEAMHDKLLWSDNGTATPQAQAVLEHLSKADSKGLPASAYVGVNWLELFQKADAEPEPMCRDLAFSVTVMRYITHLRVGQINPSSLGTRFLDFSSKQLDLADFIIKLSQATDPAVMLDSLEPTSFPYQTLVKIVQKYYKFANDPQLKTPLANVRPPVRPGMNYKDAALLAYKLEALGDLPSGQAASYTESLYSNELAQAVTQFQKRNGLKKADGLLGAKTIQAINNSINPGVGVPLPKLLAALERWRWMPNTLGFRPILVNVPEYKLYALEDDGKGWYQPGFSMNVVVGKNDPKYRTPRVHSAIRSIEFTPYWNVPISILRRELYSSLRGGGLGGSYEIVRRNGSQKSLSLNKSNLAALWKGDLLLRQKPGKSNVLGTAKFIFPNKYGVYLHDTLSKGFFSRGYRAQSHGCVRVADPRKLATYILQDDGWDRKRVNAVMDAKKHLFVNPKKPFAVYLIYDTLMVKPDGKLRLIPDVYGYDPALVQALEQASKATPPL